jgi:hypothetical protein
MRLRLALAALAAVGTGACGHGPQLAGACRTGGQSAVLGALRTAPDRALLPGGTRLSDCVRAATSPGDLPLVGMALTDAGDRLARRAARDPGDALRLGFLQGAAERGARSTDGIADELVNRLAHLLPADEASPAARAAYERGRSAGLARG